MVGWAGEDVTGAFVDVVVAGAVVIGGLFRSTVTVVVLTPGCVVVDLSFSVTVDEDNTESNQVLASVSVSFSSHPPDALTHPPHPSLTPALLKPASFTRVYSDIAPQVHHWLCCAALPTLQKMTQTNASRAACPDSAASGDQSHTASPGKAQPEDKGTTDGRYTNAHKAPLWAVPRKSGVPGCLACNLT